MNGTNFHRECLFDFAKIINNNDSFANFIAQREKIEEVKKYEYFQEISNDPEILYDVQEYAFGFFHSTADLRHNGVTYVWAS
ncbi:3979_t:CDS:2 [Gigaspora margarita]|uniref:3979_t:CDS:1 n=1 Tax=Gigaspora margarita TaxID=4874 RepID=A0ABN7UZS1_GIGMA|nr:3979_t:CDS:2 [Gigaspora margarita]